MQFWKKLLVINLFFLTSTETQAVNVYVDAGVTVQNGQVLSVQNQIVNGTTENYTVYGTQTVANGGLAKNSLIYSYATQIVQSGGTADNTHVMANGYQEVSGTVNGSVIDRYASMTVKDQGVSNGAASSGTIYVNSGGTVNNTTLNSRSNMYVSGNAEYTTLNYSTLTLQSGGRSLGTQIGSSSTETVNSGATSSQAVINGGIQNVYGTSVAPTLNSGTLNIWNNGVLQNGIVNGGIMAAESGSTIDNLTVNGGWALFYEGTTVQNNLSVSNANVDIYGAVDLPNLELDNARVDLSGGSGYNEININQLSGNGDFILSSNAAGGLNDKLNISSGSGNFGIGMADYSETDVFPNEIQLVQTADNNENFYLLGGAVDIGAYRYDLQHNGNEWVLNRTPQLTDTSIIAKNVYTSLKSVYYTHLQTLNSRLGEVRFLQKEGVWGKGILREAKYSFDDNTKSRVSLQGFQVGADAEIKQDILKKASIGLFGGYTESSQKFDRSGYGNGDTYSLGIYTIWQGEKNRYLDLIASYYMHRQRVTSFLPMGISANGKYNVNAWSLSAEVGQKFDFAEGWFLEPQLQAVFMKMDNVRYQNNYNLLVDARNNNSFSGRFSLRAGKDFNEENYQGRFFVISGLVKEFQDKAQVKVANYTFYENNKDVMFEFGGGVNLFINNKTSLYFTALSRVGDKVRFPYDIDLGFRYEF